MDIKILGVKLRVECILISMVIGAVLGCYLICGCVTQEGMESAGAAIDYAMSKGVHTDKYESKYDQVEVNGGSNLSPKVPLPEGQMFLFANNEFKPECCGSSISSSSGCACVTKSQIDYINQRGGNRTLCGGYAGGF